MKLRNLAMTALTIFTFSSATQAQSTWDNIYTILNTKCTSTVGGCHEQGSSNPSFNVEAPVATLYTQLINGSPVNPYAKDSANNKLVVPGSPTTSFMMRKLAQCTSGPLVLKQPFEGATMPGEGTSPRLPDAEVELIYTWIAAGAPDTGTVSPDTIAGDICDLGVGIKMLPAKNILFTAYPNPASENLSFSYILERPALITMELLEVTGKQVKTLFSEKQTSGYRQKTITPGVSQGIYFIKLTIGNDAQYMKKIVLQ